MIHIQDSVDCDCTGDLSQLQDRINSAPYPFCSIGIERDRLGFRSAQAMKVHSHNHLNALGVTKGSIDRRQCVLVPPAFRIMYVDRNQFGLALYRFKHCTSASFLRASETWLSRSFRLGFTKVFNRTKLFKYASNSRSSAVNLHRDCFAFKLVTGHQFP